MLILFAILNFTGAMFIQGATFIPDSRVDRLCLMATEKKILESYSTYYSLETIARYIRRNTNTYRD